MIDIEERRKGIGGTDSAVVLGVSHWKNIVELWEEKVGLRFDSQEETPAMKRGKKLEDIAAREYAEVTSRKVQCRSNSFVHPDHSFLRGNIDREILGTDKGVGILEIKCSCLSAFRSYKFKGIPDEYMIQLQHYLLVTGRSWGSFGLFNADLWETVVYDVESDKDIHDHIINKGAEFWKHVEEKTKPELDVEPIKLPKVEGSIVTIDSPEWLEAVNDLAEAKSMVSMAKDVEQGAKDRMIELMGDNDIVEGAECRVYHRETAGRKTVDSKRLKEVYPDTYKDCLKIGKNSRSFRPYFLKGRS